MEQRVHGMEMQRGDYVKRIMIIEDDRTLNQGLCLALSSGENYQLTQCYCLVEAQQALRARVAAQLRRGASKDTTKAVMQIGPYHFDFVQMRFRRDDALIKLSKTEQRLLRLLVENRGITLPRARLIERLWDDGADYVDENALSVTVKRLRDKLDAAAYIKTVYGIGYVWRDGDTHDD